MDIKVNQLSKHYGSQKAVDDISFTVDTGQVLGFLGPNGAGKTTTMKMITSYVAADSGDILIGDISVKEDPDTIKKHVGYLPEHNPLYLDMPVIDYLHFCAALQGVTKRLIPERIRMMVRQCGLDQEKHKKIGELSKGYRQRVGLAQAMIHDPDVLILDEPTTGLDPNQIVEIRKLIRELGSAKTVILSTHILPEVEAICDRILIINQGRIVADGTAETLRQQAQGQPIMRIKVEEAEADRVLQAIQQLPAVAQAHYLNGETNRFEVQSNSGQSVARDIFQLCVDHHWILTELTPQETKLEDIFRDLTVT